MECPSCHSDTPDTSKFCIACGATLEARCSSCGSANRPNAKFCAECGKALTASPPPAREKPSLAAASPITPAASAERRQLTVVFCDLVGSTALSARLDPEDMREIIGAYHRCCAEQITKAGGFVAKYMGDGVLAYFGYPQAHEDDAERAVRAALGLIDAVPRLRTAYDDALQVRIGVATGLVVVGDLIGEGASQEQGVVGETPNLAARLQALAEPGQVVISQVTRRLTGGTFEYLDLGRVPLKGLADPVQAWRVTGTAAVESRFEARHETGLTPLVGREEELDLLTRRWRQAASGEGRVVLLSGEPGIGKSRLISSLQERIKSDPHVRIRLFCSPQHTDSALYPVINFLRRAARFAPDDTSEQRLAKVVSVLAPIAALAGFERDHQPEQKLAALDALLQASPGHDEQSVALLADLLSVPTGGKYRLSELSPKRRKEKVLEALAASIAAFAAQKPGLMVFEDVHWIDPTSLEMLASGVERIRRLPVLMVISARPEFSPPWPAHAHVTTLPLARLNERDAAEVVNGVTGGKALPEELLEQILARTDGVPLFLEELSKSMLESGALAEESGRYVLTGALPRTIPSTLHASLVARIDRLPSARHVAQVAAVIGREFSDELVRAVTGLPEGDVRAALNQLVGAELVFRQGVPPNARYTFKHTLVQEAVYETLLRGARQEHHRRVVQVLEQQFPDVVTAEPERLAQHCVSAGFAQRGAEYWLIAARQSLARSALTEAASQARKGLECFLALADSGERQSLEIELQATLGRALLVAKGHAVPEVGQAFARASSLARAVDDTARLLPILHGQYEYCHNRANVSAARDLAEELLGRAEQQNDPLGIVIGHLCVGESLHALGRLAPARGHLEQVLVLYDRAEHRHSSLTYGPYDALILALYVLQSTLFALGYPEQAQRRANEAVTHARTLGHPATLVLSMEVACSASIQHSDWRRVQAHADRMLALATEHDFPEWVAYALYYQGCTEVEAGKADQGLARLREAFATLQRLGQIHALPSMLYGFAEAHRSAGRKAEALAVLADAMDLTMSTGACRYEAELHRMHGELLMGGSPVDQTTAEADFRKALAVARQQEAKLWELRASTSLARLWRDQGKRSEARDLLAPIYGWFTEGFDAPDLKEAKALLDELI